MASKEIPYDQLTDEEKQVVKSTGGLPFTEANREARNKLAEQSKEAESDTKTEERVNTGISIAAGVVAGVVGGPLVGIAVAAATNAYLNSDPEEKKPELTEEEQKEKAKLNHQAYLMFNWENLTSYSANRPEPFKYFAQVMHNEPAELNNILFRKPPIFDILLKSKSVDLSYFVPKIRLFKEFKLNNGKQVVDIELPLSEQYKEEDFESIFQSKEGRGGGVGLKSFKWNTIGNSQGNQYTFGAELELFFENISEISKIRSIDTIGGITYKTSFEDLLIQKSPTKKDECGKSLGGEYDPEYYRVKALIGWHIPRDSNAPVPEQMIRELEDSNLSLYMGLHSHEIDIADDSTVTLKIKYIAYLEAIMDHPTNSNVFYGSDDYEVTIQNKKNEIEAEKQTLNGTNGNTPLEGVPKKTSETNIENIEKQIEKEQTTNKIVAYQRILNYIYNNNLIKYITVNPDAFKAFMDVISRPKNQMQSEQQIAQYNAEMDKIKQANNSAGGSATYPNTSVGAMSTPEDPTTVSTTVSETIDAANARLATSATNGDIVIPYFYVGDLIDSMLKGMYGKDKEFAEKDIKLILGPLIFYDYGRLSDNISLKPAGLSSVTDSGAKINIKSYTGTKTVINIADIPISLDIFTTWFTKKIVDAGVVNMTVKDFISAIMNDLVIRAVGVETYAFAPRQKTRLVYKTKTIRSSSDMFAGGGRPVPASYSQGTATGRTYKSTGLKFNAYDLKFYNTSDVVEQVSEIDNIALIYSVSDQSFELLSDYDMDIRRGIRHIVYGAETGLIKNIKFKRQDNPLIRSHNMRMASKQAAGNGVILREVYNANVEMYGNSLFEIGEIIYVSPTLFGSVSSLDFVKNLGIGGYFMILKVDNSIEDGSFTTSLELRWNAKGDGMPNNLNDGSCNNKTDQGIKIL